MNQIFNIDLNNNWKFKIEPDSTLNLNIPVENDKWYHAAVPGTIHTDLLYNNLIDDPFLPGNEIKYSWISNCSWIYKTDFEIQSSVNLKADTYLEFMGIDTVSKISVNGNSIGVTNNMFCSYRFNVSKFLNIGLNSIQVEIESPIQYAKQKEKLFGKLPVSLNSERAYIRKAQYSFGWDWGPSFPTMGIWKEVRLFQNEVSQINDIFFETQSIENDIANCKLNLTISSIKNILAKVRIELSIGSQLVQNEFKLDESSECSYELKIENPKLWWPKGYGKPNLYVLKIQLINNDGDVVNETTKKVGIRTVALQLQEDGKQNFYFLINDKKIFAKGMNWIPADLFLPGVTKKKYKELLTMASNSNANMIRVWGGGIYEQDIFYELCDELGLLVWQDFMFACAAYPEDDEFLQGVEIEVIQNVNRLKNHPCIAVWCGNNENEWNWQKEQELDFTIMPGYTIFHKLIPNLLEKINSTAAYWPSSPFGNDNDVNSQTSGNRHQWDIWSNWIEYSEVYKDNSLFVSEFGFQAPANIDTFKKYLETGKRKIQDPIFENYNKQIDGMERIFRFLAGDLPLTTNWQDFIYLAQLNQGLALKTCIEHWRTNNKTNGSLIWQLNDCWPATSWSLIDSELKPKLSYHFVKNIFSPTILTFDKTHKNLKIICLNESQEFCGYFQMNILDLITGEFIMQDSKKIFVKSYNIFEIEKFTLTDLPDKNDWIAIASIYDIERNLLHRNFHIPKKWKHVKLPKTEISIKSKHNNSVYVSCDKTLFFVDLYQQGINFLKRGIIILPGEEIEVSYTSSEDALFNIKNLNIFALNNYLQ